MNRLRILMASLCFLAGSLAGQALAQENTRVWPASSIMKVLKLQKDEFVSLEKVDQIDRELVLPSFAGVKGLVSQALNEPWVADSAVLLPKIEALSDRVAAIESAMQSPGLTRDHLRQTIKLIDDYRQVLVDAGFSERYHFYYIVFGLRHLELKLTGLDVARRTLVTDVLVPAQELLEHYRQGALLNADVSTVFATEIAAVKDVVAKAEAGTVAPDTIEILRAYTQDYKNALVEGGAVFTVWYPRDQFQLLTREMDRLNGSLELFEVRKNVFAPVFAQMDLLAQDLIDGAFTGAQQDEKVRQIMTQHGHPVADLPDFDGEGQTYMKDAVYYMFKLAAVINTIH